jgi:hypothetical protein
MRSIVISCLVICGTITVAKSYRNFWMHNKMLAAEIASSIFSLFRDSLWQRWKPAGAGAKIDADRDIVWLQLLQVLSIISFGAT